MSSADRGVDRPRLVVTGVDGAVARAVLRAARHDVGTEVSAALRTVGRRRPVPTDGVPSALAAEAGPTLTPAPVVVVVALSTDLGLDLGLNRGDRRSGLVELTGAAERAVEEGGHLVVVTSARVYGAVPGRRMPIEDDDPMLGAEDDSIVGDLLAVEAAVERIRVRRPDLLVTVVRPAAVVGPGVDTTTTRHFETSRLLVVRGTHQWWQFVHVDDLADAVRTVVRCRLGPIVTIGCEGWMSQDRVELVSGKRRLELPASVVASTLARLSAVHVLTTPGKDLDYLRYPWVVSSRRLRASGWRPRYDNETCFGALLDEVRTERTVAALRRDTAVGTAGTAVTLVGTAAMMRRRRRRTGRR